MELESSKSHILSPPSRWQNGFGQMGLAWTLVVEGGVGGQRGEDKDIEHD